MRAFLMSRELLWGALGGLLLVVFVEWVTPEGTKPLAQPPPEESVERSSLVDTKALAQPPAHVVRVGVACTGSMEPAITCLDEITLLTSFRPEDIQVGAVVALRSSRGDAPGVLHRVIQVVQRDGAYYYWTRGDNVDRPDELASEDRIGAVVVEVHKDARLENGMMRKAVNAATEAYKAALADYTALSMELCGKPDPESGCPQVSPEEMDRLLDAFVVYADALCTYELAQNQARSASGFPPMSNAAC